MKIRAVSNILSMVIEAVFSGNILFKIKKMLFLMRIVSLNDVLDRRTHLIKITKKDLSFQLQS